MPHTGFLGASGLVLPPPDSTLASSSRERPVWGSACWSRRANSFGVRMAGAKKRRKRKPLTARYFTSCGVGAAGERPTTPAQLGKPRQLGLEVGLAEGVGAGAGRPSWPVSPSGNGVTAPRSHEAG